MKIQHSKQDDFVEGIRDALNTGNQADTEKRLTGMVRDFQVRLRQHPAVVAQRAAAQPPPRRRAAPFLGWAAAAIVLLGGVLAGASLLVPGLGAGLSSRIHGRAPVARPAVARQELAPQPILLGRGVGPVRIGMSLDQVRQVWGDPDKTTDGTEHSYFRHGVQLTVTPTGGVRKIHCTLNTALPGDFSTFVGTTPEGIGIGATEEQVLQALGQPDRRTGSGSGSGSLELVYRRGLTVVLDAAPAMTDWHGERRVVSLSVVPPREDGN